MKQLLAIKTPTEIEAMRTGGRMLAHILALMEARAEPGISPKELAAMAAGELKKIGGEPAFLHYPGRVYGFPDVICISVNDQVQHSIPSDRPLEMGDIVNFDFGVRFDEMITDGGITVCVGGRPSGDDARLIKGTKLALEAALRVVRHGCRVGDISAVVERVLRKHQLGIVRELVGHGVGHQLHEEPEIPNYGRAGTGPVLKAGMTIAIEPITTLGSPAIMEMPDGWTLKTRDGSRSAQFEHTVLVTPTGCEVLTTL